MALFAGDDISLYHPLTVSTNHGALKNGSSGEDEGDTIGSEGGTGEGKVAIESNEEETVVPCKRHLCAIVPFD